MGAPRCVGVDEEEAGESESEPNGWKRGVNDGKRSGSEAAVTAQVRVWRVASVTSAVVAVVEVSDASVV